MKLKKKTFKGRQFVGGRATDVREEMALLKVIHRIAYGPDRPDVELYSYRDAR